MPSRPTPPRRKPSILLLFAACILAPGLLHAETCITQSQIKPADRDNLAATALSLATLVKSKDAPALRQRTLPEYAKDFSGMTALVGNTATRIQDASLTVEQLYLLDASTLKPLPDGTNQDAQFFCSLNKSMAEANFLIPALPPGRYAFAMVNATGTKSPMRLSFLLKQSAAPAGQDGAWTMAGFYPRPLTAAGHDGLWYWTQARDLVKQKQFWAAHLYYRQAESLLQPAGFVSSTHLDKLRKEMTSSAPPALSEGISAEMPLVVKGKNGGDFRFTVLTTDDSLGADKVDVVAHLAPDPPPDPADSPSKVKSDQASGQKSGQKPDPKTASAPLLSPGERNTAAMSALLAAFPELRGLFHGVWIFAESAGQNPFITEQPMANIP